MEKFVETSQAFRVARERASIAQHAEASLFHRAVYDAREAGMSVRETAAALRAPKSTVARHWREGHRCSIAPPVWGTPEGWLAAEREIWAHAPREIGLVPYEWEDLADGGRTVRQKVTGVAYRGPLLKVMRKLSDEEGRPPSDPR